MSVPNRVEILEALRSYDPHRRLESLFASLEGTISGNDQDPEHDQRFEALRDVVLHNFVACPPNSPTTTSSTVKEWIASLGQLERDLQKTASEASSPDRASTELSMTLSRAATTVDSIKKYANVNYMQHSADVTSAKNQMQTKNPSWSVGSDPRLEALYLLSLFGYTCAARICVCCLSALRQRQSSSAQQQQPQQHKEEETAFRQRYSILLSNRAQCHAVFDKWTVSFQDGALAVLMNPLYLKAYHRTISACIAMDDLALANDVYDLGAARATVNETPSAVAEYKKLPLEWMAPFSGVVLKGNMPQQGGQPKVIHGLSLRSKDQVAGSLQTKLGTNETFRELLNRADVSPLMNCYGVPLMVCPLNRDKRLKSSLPDNQMATYFMIEPITGFAPPSYQGQVGSVLVFRADGESVTPAQIWLLWDFFSTTLDMYGSADDHLVGREVIQRKHFIDFQFSYNSSMQQTDPSSCCIVMKPTAAEQKEWDESLA